MVHQPFTIDEFNKVDVTRVIWEIFAAMARLPEASNSLTCFDLDSVGDSIIDLAYYRCKDAGLIPQNITGSEYPPFRHAVLKVYYSAINMGLIIPSKLNQDLNWSANSGPFHFTIEGIKYFSNESFISIDDPGYLGEALKELQQRIPTIEDGQIELLLEAQRCINARCFRAGIVVMGVANEDICLALVDTISKNYKPPAKGSQYSKDWKNCCDTSLAFATRWRATINLLEAMKSKLRTQGRGQPWWQWWEMIPDSLHTIGEAVRIARNTAAHDAARTFKRAEVALLLSAMPTQLEMIARITEFFQKPPLNLATIPI